MPPPSEKRTALGACSPDGLNQPHAANPAPAGGGALGRENVVFTITYCDDAATRVRDPVPATLDAVPTTPPPTAVASTPEA